MTRALLCLALAALSCGPIRDAVVAPYHGGSCMDAGASLCRGAVPYVCSPQGRLWPATPTGEPCPWGCTAEDAGARCMARAEADASLDAAVTP